MRRVQSLVLCGVLAICAVIVGCERQEDTFQKGGSGTSYEGVELTSPKRAVNAWYHSWNRADKGLLDQVMLHGAPKSISFIEGDSIKHQIISIKELGADFDKSQHRKAKEGDVVVITREYTGTDSTNSVKKYLLLRRQRTEWKVVTYSVIRGEKAPPLPDELYR